jgi:hypothetical protein
MQRPTAKQQEDEQTQIIFLSITYQSTGKGNPGPEALASNRAATV